MLLALRVVQRRRNGRGSLEACKVGDGNFNLRASAWSCASCIDGAIRTQIRITQLAK